MKVGFCGYKFRMLIITASFAAFIEYLLQFTDKIIIGGVLNDVAFSVTDTITPIFSIALFVSAMISTETSHCHAFYMGRFEPRRANCFFGQGVLLSAFAGVLMLVLAIVGRDTYFTYLGLSSELYDYAQSYYFYYQFSVLIYPLYMLFAKCVFEDGDELVYIASVLVRIVCNAGISYVLCREIGIAGVSIGTLVSTFISMGVLSIHLLKKRNSLRFIWHISRSDVWAILKAGAPDAVIYLYQAVFTFLLSKLIITQFGEKYLTVLSVAMVILSVSAMFESVNQAVEPLCYVYMGEGNTKQLRQIMRMAIKTAAILGAIASVYFLFFAQTMVSVIGIENADLMEASASAILIIAPSLIFAALFCVQTEFFSLVGKDGVYVVLAGMKELLLPLAIAVPLSLAMGINGIWIGFALSPFIAIAVCRFGFEGRGKGLRISLFPEEEPGVILHTYELFLREERVVEVRDQAAELLREHSFSKTTIHHVMLMIEEVFMLIIEMNRNKKIYAECTVRITDSDVQIILRDSGVIFDVTDCDLDVTSLRVYMVSRMMDNQEDKIHHVTTSYNRNAFRFSEQRG